jgi:hypothetical protein
MMKLKSAASNFILNYLPLKVILYINGIADV